MGLMALVLGLCFVCLRSLTFEYESFWDQNSQSQNSQARDTVCCVCIFIHSVIFAEQLFCIYTAVCAGDQQ